MISYFQGRPQERDPRMQDQRDLPELLHKTPFLVTAHSAKLNIDQRTEYEKNKNFQEFFAFYFTDGSVVHFYHDLSCCETFELLDVDGDLLTIEGHEIVFAEEVFNRPVIDMEDMDQEFNSETWSYYRFATQEKGMVVVRFFGRSNGYYSETADIVSNMVPELEVLKQKSIWEKNLLQEQTQQTMAHKKTKQPYKI